MEKELQDYLFSRYPKLFIEKDLPPQQTCMCWGFEHGAGWFDIVNNLCFSIQNHIEDKNKKDLNCEQVIVHQVKSKYNELRFYYSGGDEVIDALVDYAENLSAFVCEYCGNKREPEEGCSCRFKE